MEQSQPPQCEEAEADAHAPAQEDLEEEEEESWKDQISPDEEKVADGGDAAIMEDEVAGSDGGGGGGGDDDDDDDGDDDDDDYECKICGYKAADVCSFSQHLHSAHPVTTLSCSPTRGNSGEKEGADTGGSVDGEHDAPPVAEEEGQERTFPQGSTSSTPKDSGKTDRTTCTVENHLSEVEQRKAVQNTTETKVSQSTSPASILPERTTSCPSGSSKKRQTWGATASSGTATLNRTHLVCLPLVSEGLKLVWVRSEQTHELDSVSDLVEAFNSFPYPTEQEASALARRCALSFDQVKVWFMMQRVRYGISWGEGDIHETRVKLRRLHSTQQGNGSCEENEGANELRDLLQYKANTPDGLQPDCNRTINVCTEQINQVPISASDIGNNSAIAQYTSIAHHSNGSELFAPSLSVDQFTDTLKHSTLHEVHPQFHADLNHVVPHKPETRSPDVYPLHFDSSLDPISVAQDVQMEVRERRSRGPPVQLRKKSKAQLLVLRRSFVNRNWPSETEVQRLQRVTGLGRHEIRKWFADSRYQLRRSGRVWMSGIDRRSRRRRTLGRYKRGPEEEEEDEEEEEKEDNSVSGGGLYEGSEDIGLVEGEKEGVFELEPDTNMEDQHDLVEEAGRSRSGSREEDEREMEDMELGVDELGKRERKELPIIPSPSPASSSSRSSPSPSVLHGQPLSFGTEPYLRKKTPRQLDVLRRSFLRCQWPTSDDYTILQQKTGLTRTEIVQWYGDTRYHVKHSNMRWMSPEDRERVIVGISKQQRRGGRGPRSRTWLDTDADFKEPRSRNGTGAGELYGTNPSVLPERTVL